MPNNKLTVKDILDISPKTKVKLYKVVNKEDEPHDIKNYTFMFEGKAAEVPTALHDLPVSELDSGCDYEIDEHYIAIFFKEKDAS